MFLLYNTLKIVQKQQKKLQNTKIFPIFKFLTINYLVHLNNYYYLCTMKGYTMSTIFYEINKKQNKIMKKIKEPNPQVIKFESMDVIATSGEPQRKSRVTFETGTFDSKTIYNDNNWIQQ